MGITMKDIAEMVGVAESTVSRAINNKPGVGEETRQEILKIANKHNFRPNQLAQNLARQETQMIGLILPDITSLSYSEVARGIQDTAREEGYQLLLCNTDGDQDQEIKYMNWLQSNQIAGAIFLGRQLASEQIIKLGLEDYPLVLANRLVEEMMIPSVIIDYKEGAYKAVHHLLDQGYHRIGLVNGPQDNWQAQNRLQGYKQALKDEKVEFDSELVVNKEWSREGGYQGFLELVELPEPPEAIFAANDLLAAGVVEAIKMGGYLIPHDLAVVGFEDTVVTSVIDPPLTTVAQPMYKLGIEAAHKLFSLIKEEELEQQIEVLDCELIIREST
jgi:DNA-binding LacI/PurR family transcriptional regulator